MKRFRLFHSGKRVICSLLITTVLLVTILPSSFLVAPQKAEAFFGCVARPPIFTPNPIAVPTVDLGVIQISTQISTSQNAVSDRKCFLDFIVKSLSRAVVHQLVTSVIDWINRGFEGGPTFVTDPANFFGNIADQEFGRIIDGTGLGFVCDPFRLQLQLGFLQQRDRYVTPSRCTITGIVKNLTGFVNGDFNQGGWEGWVSLTTQPQNNPYGSYLQTQELIQTRIAARQNTAEMQLQWGSGFRSLLSQDGTIKTPGVLIQGQLQKAVGNDLDYLNLAREFDDVVIALVNLGISKIISGGLR